MKDVKPVSPEELSARVEILKLAASLTAPNYSLSTVIPCADKLWSWANGVPTGEVIPSKVKQAVERGLARLAEQAARKDN